VGKYDGDVYVLFVSLRGKNKRFYLQSKIKFRERPILKSLNHHGHKESQKCLPCILCLLSLWQIVLQRNMLSNSEVLL